MKDYGYRDVYEAGAELPLDRPLSARSIIIYRYYDPASKDLGTGDRREMEDYARGLGDLILRLRKGFCGNGKLAPERFRVYLVAHSMGGLVCRCFLQHPALVQSSVQAEFASARSCVDKVFTYATPHNGIDLNVIGNVPGFFTRNNADDFNRARMRQYLGLEGEPDDVATLDGDFDPERFFCLVGTNHRDYDVGLGVVSKAVGPMSDGLVRIVNATVSGPKGGGTATAPRAFVHRSHSGHYGVVNSEEGYQNLIRFLFGDARIDGTLEISELTLPPDVEKAKQNGKEIRASYHFEVIVRTRGALWDLHRRTVGESSAIFRTYDEMLKDVNAARFPQLFSTFLSTAQRVNVERPSLGFSIDLGVLVPQYEVDRALVFDQHYEGGYLYRDKLNLEAVPPADRKQQWQLKYGFDSKTPNRTQTKAEASSDKAGMVFRIPIEQKTRPGIRAQLVLTAKQWNQW
jgi:hypothetical protein